ncbi:MAG: hypothetical protein JST12_05870 [Armatimonadetes bacterium]|nr:hypothetical protein [Armatimonadota bacterium]
MVFRATKWYRTPEIQVGAFCAVAGALQIAFRAKEMVPSLIALCFLVAVAAPLSTLRYVREIEVTPDVLRLRRGSRWFDLTKNDIDRLQTEIAGYGSRVVVRTVDGNRLVIPLIALDRPGLLVHSLQQWVTLVPKFGTYRRDSLLSTAFGFLVFSLFTFITNVGGSHWPIAIFSAASAFFVMQMTFLFGGIKMDVGPTGLTICDRGDEHSVRWDELSQVKLTSSSGRMRLETATISHRDRTWRLREFGNYLDLRDTILANVTASIVVDNRQI